MILLTGESDNAGAKGGESVRSEGTDAAKNCSPTAAKPTPRAEAKAARREQLLSVAKTLYARHGFHGVRLDDLGKGAGISAPAVYRHFDSKEAVLEELLIGISEYLHAGGTQIIAAHEEAAAASALGALIDFHVEFAMSEPELIRIQDRDFTALPEESRRTVRRLQRSYVSAWADVVSRLHPEWSLNAATVRVHAVFGMMNSTPYQARRSSAEVVGVELRAAASAALGLA
ncbi:TetR family transcriptional regulator [Brevibacterium sp. CCUG 69071]|nr:TetR family transcriptional regulator [Brevibacterium sp. CCUG 69071]